MKLVSQTQAEGGGAGGARPKLAFPRWLAAGGCLSFLLILLAVGGPVWWWYWWRIEPDPGRIAVLIRKTGKDLPAGAIIAPDRSYKGIQLEVLPEGRYFRNPYDWTWEYHSITDIPAGQLGVKVRRFGDDLPPGELIAKEGTRGILPDVLSPGKYRINPYAYEVRVLNAIKINPGSVGVVTSLVGKDVLADVLPEGQRNTFLTGDAMKGVQATVLDPGTYYLNPYMAAVVEVNLQSQRFEMSGAEAISFLTMDGFTVTVEGTIEFNIRRANAALLTHQVGDMDDIAKKIIMPRARGFSRIEGSKKSAVEFIVGETRQQFQNSLEAHLKETCDPWGISVNSVLVRNIIPPQEIAGVIRDRELAAQEARKFEQQIEQAKSRAELVKQQMLAEQNSRKVAAETDKLRAEIAAKQDQSVRLTAARRDLDVAKIGLQTAQSQAAALILAAEADQAVIRQTNEAEAAVLAGRVKAFGSGDAFVRYLLYGRLAPRIESILTTDQPGDEFGLPLRREAPVRNTPAPEVVK